jgi:hypothetical protein
MEYLKTHPIKGGLNRRSSARVFVRETLRHKVHGQKSRASYCSARTSDCGLSTVMSMFAILLEWKSPMHAKAAAIRGVRSGVAGSR